MKISERDFVSQPFEVLRSKLRRIDTVRTVAWQTGSAVHHTVPTITARFETVQKQSESVFSGETIPTYPYLQTATDPLSPHPPDGTVNPVLTARDVTDFGDADGVADPFVFVTPSGEWHMFMEVYNRDMNPTAAIGHATSPDGGLRWEYDQIVLNADVHLSFPYVFRWNGVHYLLPDRWNKRADHEPVTLYKSTAFPDQWTQATTILPPDTPVSDVVLFRYHGRWWAIGGDERDLYAYYSDDGLDGDWHPHDDNPIVQNRPRAARPGGRPIVRDEYILLFLQDCARMYGEQVRAFRIEKLTPRNYTDVELSSSPTLQKRESAVGWNSKKMHHIDPWYDGSTWRCAVDGDIGFGREIFGNNWSIGMWEEDS